MKSDVKNDALKRWQKTGEGKEQRKETELSDGRLEII